MEKIFYIVIIFCHFEFYSLFSSENLKSTENQADYLVIYHPEFKETIKEFVEWRRLKGVNVLPIDVNDIYDEFGDTVSNVDAIRDFVSYSLEFWKETKPRYLLLVGGINHIPSKVCFYKFGNDTFCTDDYFARNKYDIVEFPQIDSLDISIGRFPVSNDVDLINIIEKTKYFEDNNDEIEYRYSALISVDSKDFDMFDYYVKILNGKDLPSYLKIKRFDYNNDSIYHGNKSEFVNIINDGAILLFNYFHGAEDIWMFNKLLTSDDLDSLNFSYKPFIINSIACSQTWDNPEKKGIIEKFITKSKSGAVASIASNALSYTGESTDFIDSLMHEIFFKEEKFFGTAIIKAKNLCNHIWLQRYTYLGDPMLRLPDRLFEPNAISEYFKNVNLSNFPNPCHEYTNIMFSVEDDTNVELDIFDILGNKIENLYSGFSPATVQNIRWDTSNLNNGIYICRLKSGKNVFSKTISVSR